MPRSVQPASLEEVSRDIGRIAAELAELAEARAFGRLARAPEIEITAALVRALIKARALRADYLGLAFGDAGWNMMLELFAARLEQRRVKLSSLSVAAGVAPTTALRWMDSLCEEGVLVRQADPAHGRRIYIDLSDGAAARMRDHLAATLRAEASAP